MFGRVVEAKLWGVGVPTVDDVGVIELTVELEAGAPVRQIRLSQRIDVDEAPQAGDQIAILIDPRRPARSRLAPDFWRVSLEGKARH